MRPRSFGRPVVGGDIDLSAHRTAALRIELARRPETALAVMIDSLASELLYEDGFPCLDVSAKSPDLARHVRYDTDSFAHEAMEAKGRLWCDRLPDNPADVSHG